MRGASEDAAAVAAQNQIRQNSGLPRDSDSVCFQEALQRRPTLRQNELERTYTTMSNAELENHT